MKPWIKHSSSREPDLIFFVAFFSITSLRYLGCNPNDGLIDLILSSVNFSPFCTSLITYRDLLPLRLPLTLLSISNVLLPKDSTMVSISVLNFFKSDNFAEKCSSTELVSESIDYDLIYSPILK